MKMQIEIQHTLNTTGAVDIAPVVDLDNGPLSMPNHISIGSTGFQRHPIGGYSDQVDEYDIWLEDQIKSENVQIMVTLDDIFMKAQTSGVILVTQNIARFTHAHVVKRLIETLAGEVECSTIENSTSG